VNAREEAGDLLWYLALIARALGTDLETIARTNIEKLRTRYPGKFTAEAALNRDLEAERKTLEELSPDDADRISWLEQQREQECKQKLAALNESEVCLKETKELRKRAFAAEACVKAFETAPNTLAQIRRLMGYVENGTEQSVKFFQDDATKTFFVIVGNRAFEGRSMAQALTKALEANPEDPT